MDLHACVLYQKGLNVSVLEGSTFSQDNEKLNKF